MSKEEYLSIFGAILFGLSASLYLFSWAHLVKANKVAKEAKYFIWSFPFFLLTLINWYSNWEVVSKIDTNIWYYLAGFVNTGQYFVISVVINPRKTRNINWQYLQSRTHELILLGTLIIIWSFVVQWIYGVQLILPLGWSTPPFVILILWYWLKRPWVGWVYIAYIYAISIMLLVALS